VNASRENQPENVTRPRVGVVVIGRNEGQRLVRCLRSVLGNSLSPNGRPTEGSRPMVYVDSNSSDSSVENARALGALVVALDTTRKFTAARARNAGLAKLLDQHPDLAFVQFLDGDTELDPGWLEVAESFLERYPDQAVACGRRRERFPGQSVYNRLCDLEWDTPVGQRASCGGDAMIRVTALRAVSGYRESLIAGEEPEMCFRMRQLGFRIMRLDSEMTLHDAAMTRFGQWFQRSRRAGHAYAEMAALHGKHAERPGVRPVLRALFWGVGWPVSALALGIWLGPWPGVSMLTFGPLYLFWRSYRSERRRGDRSTEDARLYAAACVLAKVPEAVGVITYLTNRLLSRPSTLLEYKSKVIGT
jgi:glycosyltransferase involved in cell wall biosynthesis